ncbi:MAG TPA: DUF6252 family protein [Cyclobacteriaceae bacterium]
MIDASYQSLNNLNSFIAVRPLPENTEMEDNPYGIVANVSAEVNGKTYFDAQPSVFEGGLQLELRSSNNENPLNTIRFRLKSIQEGIYTINQISGFNQILFNELNCSDGEISISKVDENNKLFSGLFQFKINDTITVTGGRFFDIPFSEPPNTDQAHFFSADINGHNFQATDFEVFLGAAIIILKGYNEVGNVGLQISVFFQTEPGTYDITDEDSPINIGFIVAKENLTPINGSINVESNDNNGISGTFDLLFDEYSIKEGVFEINLNPG